jgi:hypothetical protein
VVPHLGLTIVPSHPTLYRLNMWSSWVTRKDGPKRDTKTFSMIWKKLSKWYDGGGENGII